MELTRNPAGLISALEKLEANDRPFAKFNHATAAMCIDDPLQHHEGWFHRLFDTHPPLDERIAILRRLEGLDPDQRGPVDETATGVPVDLSALADSTGRRTARDPVLTGGLAVNTPTDPAAGAESAPLTIPHPGASPPGWFRRDATTLRYWNGNVFTDWTATWNGTRWVQSRSS